MSRSRVVSLFAILSLRLIFVRSLNSSTDKNQIPKLDDINATALDDIDYPIGNCSNEYCLPDEDYIDLMIDHILPTPFEWVLIGMHVITFVIGLVGNALVCIAVYKNRGMRNVTNYFIVNLAVADFMVILFCLPPTVVWDVTETWFMGTLLCKIVLYFQTVSVAVSVLTLTFISVDRWYAICFPLKFKSTTTRAKISIIIIWITSLTIDIPELIVLKTAPRQEISVNTQIFTQCTASWSSNYETIYQVAKISLLYVVPLLFMTVAYFQIVRVLWTSDNIPGHTETVKMMNSAGLYHNALNNRRIPTGSTTESQLRSRRKAAKMLVAVVVMFALCYFPVHLLNILRNLINVYQSEVTSAISNLTHWLCYANSAINPIIYNFMSAPASAVTREAEKAVAKNRKITTSLECTATNDQIAPATAAAPIKKVGRPVRTPAATKIDAAAIPEGSSELQNALNDKLRKFNKETEQKPQTSSTRSPDLKRLMNRVVRDFRGTKNKVANGVKNADDSSSKGESKTPPPNTNRPQHKEPKSPSWMATLLQNIKLRSTSHDTDSNSTHTS